MMQRIDNAFDEAFFCWLSCCAEQFPKHLGHAYYGMVLYDLKVSTKLMSETGLNAAVAGYYNVSVVLVIGDETVNREAVDLLGRLETVASKSCWKIHSPIHSTSQSEN
jgi:D-amino peptidase